jgi:hypothetical protein
MMALKLTKSLHERISCRRRLTGPTLGLSGRKLSQAREEGLHQLSGVDARRKGGRLVRTGRL